MRRCELVYSVKRNYVCEDGGLERKGVKERSLLSAAGSRDRKR